MSIHTEIDHLIGKGKLFSIEPFLGDPVARMMVISPEIQGLLDGPWESETMERRCGRLEADLQAFVKGDNIALSLTPYEHKTAYLGRLDRPKDEVWDIRSRDPSPGLRVFGRFGDIDLFVALSWAPRSVGWGSQSALGDVSTMNWDFAILECQERWNDLLPGHKPIHGEGIHDYVSSNVFLV
jgi:hypothetical protein